MTRRHPRHAPPPVHSDAAHRAISAELVRLTLGGRDPRRPELRVDMYGILARTLGAIADDVLRAQRLTARQVARVGTEVLRTLKAQAESDATRRARATRQYAGEWLGIPVYADDNLPPGTGRIEQTTDPNAVGDHIIPIGQETP